MLNIGITGGIGSGKSTIAKIFKALGIPIYDADSRSRYLQETDQKIIDATKAIFGLDAYLPDGRLNRQTIAQRVFQDKNKLAKLNAIVHPLVYQDYDIWRMSQKNSPYIIRESALLFDAPPDRMPDKVIVVAAPDDMRVKRVRTRDPHRSIEDIQAIISKQLPAAEMIAHADYVITNDDTCLVVPQVVWLHKIFMSS